MFNFCSLYSGSSGNSLLAQSENTNILIDTGESAKKIVNALSSINVSIENINAIIVTHEHLDHVKSLGTISQKYNIPVYANKETWSAMPNQSLKVSPDLQKFFIPHQKFIIGDLEIEPFSIPHDAANPCGFNIFHDNKQLSIATDIMKNYGVDTYIGKVASVIMGSTETTFYILAVYLSCVKIKNNRGILIAALTADIIGIISSVIFCRILS